MLNKNTILLVDGTNRYLNIYAVSATEYQDANGERMIVLRKGIFVGSLYQVTRDVPFCAPYPMMVVGDYQAQSSAGFVELIFGECCSKVYWAGGAGFPAALYKFSKPFAAKLFASKTMVYELGTHDNSNIDTAAATLAGIRLRSQLEEDEAFLVEGQSDQVSVWEFDESFEARPIFPTEHRLDIFCPEVIVNAVGGPCSEG